MGKFHTQIAYRQDSLKAQSVSHTKHLYEPRSHGRTDQGIAVKDAKPMRVFDINRGAAVLLLSTLAAMTIRPVGAPPTPPTLVVSDPHDNLVTRPTFTVSGDKYCKVIEASLDPNVGSTIHARYASMGNAWGQTGFTYVCGETAPIRQYGIGIYGSPFIPNTGRLPKDGVVTVPALAGVIQDFDAFTTECQAVIAWCGSGFSVR